MKAIVLSAGLGQRLRPYTQKLAKPAIPFFTIPMAGFCHYYLKKAGVRNFLVNTHHLPQTVIEAYNFLKSDETINYLHEPKLLGSAGTVRAFKDQLNESFFLLNGDSVFILPEETFLQDVFEQHVRHDHLATLVVKPHPQAGKTLSACWVDKNNHVVGFGLTCDIKNATPMHFTGIQVLHNDLPQSIKEEQENILYEVLSPLLSTKRVKAFVSDDFFWHETGNPSDYFKATRKLIEAIKEESSLGQSFLELLKSYCPNLTVTHQPMIISDGPLTLPETILVREFLICGKNSHIRGTGPVEPSILGANLTLTAPLTKPDTIYL